MEIDKLIELNENNIIEIKKFRKSRTLKPKNCYKCCIPIENSIGKYNICKDCYNSNAKIYYQTKIKPNRISIKRKKICYQKEYTTPTGDIIMVNLKSDNKNCNKCLQEKLYTEFYTIICNNNYYLLPSCKICINKNLNKKNKKQEINTLIN